MWHVFNCFRNFLRAVVKITSPNESRGFSQKEIPVFLRVYYFLRCTIIINVCGGERSTRLSS